MAAGPEGTSTEQVNLVLVALLAHAWAHAREANLSKKPVVLGPASAARECSPTSYIGVWLPVAHAKVKHTGGSCMT